MDSRRICKDIIVTNWIGMAGTTVLARVKREELLLRYTSHFITGADMSRYMADADAVCELAMSHGAVYAQEIGDCGVFAALWDMGVSLNCGMDVFLKKIPIKQETVELCNFYNINPYKMYSLGSVLIVTDDSGEMLNALENAGTAACVVGRTNGGRDRVIINGDEKRFIEPARGREELLKTVPRNEWGI